MKRVTDKSFRYDPSHDTDIKRRFARIAREQREQAKRDAAAEAEAREKLAGQITPRRKQA